MDGRRTVGGKFHKLDGAGEASPIEDAADSAFRPCLPNPRCSHPKCPPACLSPEDFPAEYAPPECPPECPPPECPPPAECPPPPPAPPPPCCPSAGARRQITQTKIGRMRGDRGRKPARLPMAFPTPGDPLPFYLRSGGAQVRRAFTISSDRCDAFTPIPTVEGMSESSVKGYTSPFLFIIPRFRSY